MIYWLNGAYGVGKSTVAKRLVPLLHNAHIFNPELLGDGIRDNYPESLLCETYEEYPFWLESCYGLLKDLYARYDGDIVAPMTLMREASYAAIVQRLMKDGVPVRYIYLDADEPTLRYRLIDLGREEPDSWCVQHIPICLAAQKKDTHAVHVNTVGLTPDEIASAIVALSYQKAQETSALHIITSYAELDGPKLMEIYAEGNRENADYFYPDLQDKALAIQKVEEEFLRFLREEFFVGPDPTYFVLEEAGEWVSALRLSKVEPGLYYLEALETRPGYRQKGCAARLLKEVIAHLKGKGPFRICDCVDKENEASIRTHLACGFQIVSETGHDYLRNTFDPYDYSMEYRFDG